MVYVTYYNEKIQKFDIASEDVNIKNAKKPEEYGQIEVGHFKTKSLAQASADLTNYKIKAGEIKMIKCKSCKKWFLLTKNSQQFYIEKGFKLPVRCRKCREKRKNEIEQSNKVKENKEEV